MGTDTKRASEVVNHMTAAISGDLWGKQHEPAGCVEVVPVFVAAMDKADYTGGSINSIKTRERLKGVPIAKPCSLLIHGEATTGLTSSSKRSAFSMPDLRVSMSSLTIKCFAGRRSSRAAMLRLDTWLLPDDEDATLMSPDRQR